MKETSQSYKGLPSSADMSRARYLHHSMVPLHPVQDRQGHAYQVATHGHV